MQQRLLPPVLLGCFVFLLACRRAPDQTQSTSTARTELQTNSAATLVSDPAPALAAPPPTTNTPALPELVQSNAPPVSAVPAPVERGVRLQMKWPPGQRYVYRLDLDQHSTNRIVQFPRTRVEDLALGLTYALTVRSGTNGPRKELEVELLAYDIAVKIGGIPAITFDSSATNQGADPITAPFGKLPGSKLRLQLDANGKVESVVGLNEWTERVVGENQGPAEDMIRQQFNDGFFRQMADFGRGFGAGPVEVGENWPYRTEVLAGGLGKIQVNSLVTLSRLEEHEQRKVAVLDSKGTLKGIRAAGSVSPGDLSLEQGTTSTQSWFDLEMGALVESSVEQSMQLSGQVPGAADPGLTPATFTSDIGQKVTVKLVEAR